MEPRVERFVGTWRLLSMETHTDSGRIVYPLGPDARGVVIYSEAGYMNVSIMAGERPFFSSDAGIGQRGTTAELVGAMKSYLSYAGPFEVLDDRVVHHVEISLFPNWIGTDQTRYYRFVDRRLYLSTEPLAADGVLSGRGALLSWERAISS